MTTIHYCSNDSSAKYGPDVFAVEVGRLPHESATEAFTLFAHVVPMDVEPDNVWGCPTALVIDLSGDSPVVRPKAEAELAVDAKGVANGVILQRITELELAQTPRRLRDAALTEAGRLWLAELDAKIQDLRLSMSK